MHDFDYDAMQKKRIARGAAHMKRGSKSKKCSLPSDGMTAAQLRRLSGPVSTYKLDEPMKWESFKAMPKDLQKQYIVRLQETYQANDGMLAQMLGVSVPTSSKCRTNLSIKSLGKVRIGRKEAEIRDAKWAAFCNGVVGGKAPEQREISCDVDDAIADDLPQATDDTMKIFTEDTLTPEKIEMQFVTNACDAASIVSVLQRLYIPTGKCRIKIEIEKIDE